MARGVASAAHVDCQCSNVDAVCSSGYLAACMALEELASSRCEGAIVGGVQLLLKPRFQYEITSKSGIMRPFDVSLCSHVLLSNLPHPDQSDTPMLVVP